MSSPSFYSAYDLRIDLKNRLVVPADVRRSIDPDEKGAVLLVTFGLNDRPWIYLEETYRQLVADIPKQKSPDADLLAYIQRTYALSWKLIWDDIGRISLPDKLLQKCRTEKDVTLIGVGDHYEVWNRKAWEDRFEYLANHGELVEVKGKLAIAAATKASAPAQPIQN